MQRPKGFLLMEFIAALTLLSGLLLLASQWWQQQNRLQLRQQWIEHTDYLLQAAERFWLEQGRPPLDFAELSQAQQLDALLLPWQQPWRLSSDDSLLRLHISAPSTLQAQWFAGHFHTAKVTAEEITLSQWAPLQQATGEQYLYRVARPDKPELNQLSVSLYMQQHDVTGIGSMVASNVSAANLESENLVADEAIIKDINTQLLTATSIQTPYGDLQQLLDQLAAYEALWLECRSAGGCQ